MDGLTIARQRIAQEAVERTGFLDLGRLGLSTLPDELLQLKHLRRLKSWGGIFSRERGPTSKRLGYQTQLHRGEPWSAGRPG